MSRIFSARGVILLTDVCNCSISVEAWAKCCCTLLARSDRRDKSVNKSSSSFFILFATRLIFISDKTARIVFNVAQRVDGDTMKTFLRAA